MQNLTDYRRIFKVLSVLLRYPDTVLQDSLQDVRATLAQFPESSAAVNCGDFVAYLETTPLIDLQEEYTGTFDLSGATCLNLTYHKWGDSRERGMALAHLKQVYKAEGYELAGSELPDHLGMILELLTVCSERTYKQVLCQYSPHIRTLAGRLKERESPYFAPVEAISLICREFDKTGD